MKIKPLHDRVLVKRVEEVTKTPAELLFPIPPKRNPAKALLRRSETVSVPRMAKSCR